MTLNAAGSVLYQEACELLKHAGAVEEVATRAVKGLAGRIKVGFVGAMLFRGLIEGIKAFSNAAPDIEITLHEMNTEDQITAIERDQISVGFIHSGHLGPGIESCHMMSEPFLCCLPEGHRFAGGTSVTLAELRDEDFILFPRALSSHYYDRIVAMCITAGFSPRIHHEVRHWLTVVRMVGEGMGVALVPAAMAAATFKNVVFLAIPNNPIDSQTLSIWRRGQRSPSIAMLIAHVAQSMLRS